jgi:NhaP-type Na+/H+ or K+/H+ antiporter
VVAALHELHAPQELTTIIDSESLLNDGTAMVRLTRRLSLDAWVLALEFSCVPPPKKKNLK